MRGPSGRGAIRLARAGVLDSTSSTAGKRNEVLAVVSRASPRRVVRHAGQLPLRVGNPESASQTMSHFGSASCSFLMPVSVTNVW